MAITLRDLEEIISPTPKEPETPSEKITALIDGVLTARESGKKSYYTYIGGSLLSEECEAKAAYMYRWALPPQQYEPRILRIFQLGKEMEISILKWLSEARGMRLSEDTMSDTQEVVDGHYGHVKCHLDGIAEMDGTRYVLELKTHNDAQFRALSTRGVKVSHLKHYQQCQTYMHFSGVHQCLYIAYNKNDSRVYVEELAYDPETGAAMDERVNRLLGDGPYTRIEERWQCMKFGGCPFYNICKKGCADLMARNCRTCAHSATLKEGGKWWCTKKEMVLSGADQERGCDEYSRKNI